MDSSLEFKLQKLRQTLVELSKLWETNKNDALASFIFPWMLLSAKHGLIIRAEFWDELANHFKQKPPIETNQLATLSAAIGALQASDGRYESQYREKIDLLEKELFHRK